MALGRWLFGRPLRSDEEQEEQISPLTGVPVLGLDALASTAYGPEAALTVLIVTGASGTHTIVPIVIAILIVLALVYTSYLQTIGAYPNGGGSYTVAKENLGPKWGVVAATALCTDYVLNVAVAIAAGVGAVVSALPALLPHTLLLCLAILIVLAIINLRGVRTAGLAFSAPTYAFVAGLALRIVLGMLGIRGRGVGAAAAAGGERALTAWLVLRAFASGCTALTGVEAVSNAVPIFSQPTVRHAKQTLTAIVVILAFLLSGVAVLARSLHLVASTPGHPGYRSVLSQLVEAVFGRGVVYGAIMTAVLLVLCLSANTSFADFPRVCRLLADDGYLPETFASRGSRLVYTEGIVVLTIVAALLLVLFHGITDALIPLFAVGAFSAFTLSQLGMVAHWRRHRSTIASITFNAAGAAATGATLAIIIAAKFLEGAWLTLLIIPGGYAFFLYTQRVHAWTRAQLTPTKPLDLTALHPPLAVIPIDRVDRASIKAVRFALSTGADVHGVYVQTDTRSDAVKNDWETLIREPAEGARRQPPTLHILRSPYRRTIRPLVRFVRELADAHAGRAIAVVIPERIEPRWYQMWVHGQRSSLLKIALLMQGGPRVVVVSTPWYVTEEPGGP